ncbi:MAG TPA: LamG domain-containing protein [Sedimentisphaerales bacterium]|nr:LamG domain-containing protein [Sedimentisphaerales bacterium]
MRNNSVLFVLLGVLFCLWRLVQIGFCEGKEVSGQRHDIHIDAIEAYNVEARIAAWSPQLIDGISGKAYLLERVGSHINVEDSASLDISGNEITISLWIKPKGMRYGQEIISKSTKADESWKIAIAREKRKNRKMSNKGRINFYLKLGSIDANFVSKKLVEPGTWYHVGCVYNGKERIIYIDGEVDSRQSVSGAIGVNDEPVKIGGGGSKKWFSGAIDEVAIYNKALSAKDIRRFYLNKRKPKSDEAGLVGYWSFDNDEGVSVKDGSSNHNDGKLISSWSAEHAKYSDPRQFVKMHGREGFP